MSKRQKYLLLATLLLIAAGGASYVLFIRPAPLEGNAAAAKARADSFFSADPKEYPTTGGEKMKVQF